MLEVYSARTDLDWNVAPGKGRNAALLYDSMVQEVNLKIIYFHIFSRTFNSCGSVPTVTK